MIELGYKSSFLRQLKKLSPSLREEAIEKVELFKNSTHHAALRVHALKGSLKGWWSFSVNYRYRIIFLWEKKNMSAVLWAIGDHSVYD